MSPGIVLTSLALAFYQQVMATLTEAVSSTKEVRLHFGHMAKKNGKGILIYFSNEDNTFISTDDPIHTFSVQCIKNE